MPELFYGEYSFYTYEIVKNLPYQFNARTGEVSDTRDIINNAWAIPFSEISEIGLTKVANYFPEWCRSREHPYYYKYPGEEGFESVIEPNNNMNLVWNSQFDLSYGEQPEYFTTTGTLYTDSSVIGKNCLYCGSEVTAVQVIRNIKGITTLYFGCHFNSTSNGEISLSWSGGSVSKILIGTGQWKEHSFKTTIPSSVTQVTLTLTGPGYFDCVFVSPYLNYWTISKEDKYWNIAPVGEGAVYGMNTEQERLFYLETEIDFQRYPPLDISLSSVPHKTSWQVFDIVSGANNSIVFTGNTAYFAVADIFEDIYGTKEIVSGNTISFKANGTTYTYPTSDSVYTEPQYKVHPWIEYTVSSDRAVSFTSRIYNLNNTDTVILSGETDFVFYDDRFSTLQEWLDFYEFPYSGEYSSIGQHEKTTLVLTGVGSGKLNVAVNEGTEALVFNNNYGKFINNNGYSFGIKWVVTGDFIYGEYINIPGEYYFSGNLGHYSYYDENTNKHYFELVTGNTYLASQVDSDGTLYVIDESNLYICSLKHVHPLQSFVPIIKKCSLGITISGAVEDFSQYKYTRALYLETYSQSYDIILKYPYVTLQESSLYSLVPFDSITVVNNDNLR